jgi:hypothetical protein
LAEEPGREPGRCGFESRRPPCGELSRWCAQRPVKPSLHCIGGSIPLSPTLALVAQLDSALTSEVRSRPFESGRGYVVVCPSGQGSACKAEHAGSNPAAASKWPVAQRIEQRFSKPHCAGSSPAGPTKQHFPLWPEGRHGSKALPLSVQLGPIPNPPVRRAFARRVALTSAPDSLEAAARVSAGRRPPVIACNDFCRLSSPHPRQALPGNRVDEGTGRSHAGYRLRSGMSQVRALPPSQALGVAQLVERLRPAGQPQHPCPHPAKLQIR